MYLSTSRFMLLSYITISVPIENETRVIYMCVHCAICCTSPRSKWFQNFHVTSTREKKLNSR